MQDMLHAELSQRLPNKPAHFPFLVGEGGELVCVCVCTSKLTSSTRSSPTVTRLRCLSTSDMSDIVNRALFLVCGCVQQGQLADLTSWTKIEWKESDADEMVICVGLHASFRVNGSCNDQQQATAGRH